jgi:hypothetical protein
MAAVAFGFVALGLHSIGAAPWMRMAPAAAAAQEA